MKTATIILGILLIVSLPIIVSAADGCPAGGTGIWKCSVCAAGSATGGPVEPCGFCDGLVVAQNVIVYLMEISATVSVGMIVFGALEIMLGGGSESHVSGGRQKVINALIGFAITLASWLIVGTVLHMLSGSVNFPWNTITCTIIK